MIFLAIFILAFVFFVSGLIFSILLKRKFAGMSAQPVNTLKRGFVRVEGSVSLTDARETILSPIDGLPCVWYELDIASEKGGAEDTSWVTLINKKSRRDFKLVDDTGQVLIKPFMAKILLSRGGSFEVDRKESLPGQLKDFLSGINEDLDVYGGKKKITERIIREGDALVIYGPARPENPASVTSRFLIKKELFKPFWICSNNNEVKEEFFSSWLFHGLFLLLTLVAGIIVLVFRKRIF
jgi:hypothetical protein